MFVFFKQKTAYEMRISDWSSDVCSSDLLGDDLLDVHAALAEQLAIEEHARHRQHFALFDLVLEQRAVDRDVFDIRVENRHQIQRLEHVRAVLAAQREIGIETIGPLQALEIGRASCRARVGQSVKLTVGGGYITKKNQINT